MNFQKMKKAELIEELKKLQKQVIQRQELTIQILYTLNQSNEKIDIIRDILLLIKKHTGLAAVGIRLKEGEDYPYYVTNGFPHDFVELERYLCARDENGDIIRDTQGNACLECMCGNVIRGRTDSSYPFFTEGGSFWSNCTTELLASTTEEDRQARTRNRCNGEGYECVALIPLRSNSEVIGLLQLNDRRKGLLSLEMIQFFESIASSIGIAFARKQVVDELKKIDRIKDEFIGMVAHELRNPMTPLKSVTEMLLDGSLGELTQQQRKYIEMMARNIDRLSRFTQDVLSLARIDSNRHPIHQQEIGLLSVLKPVTDLMSSKASENSMTVAMEIPEEIKAYADADAVAQIVTNLVNNAIMHTAEGTRIVISAKPGNSSFIEVSVADNGPGIPEDKIDCIFDRFVQAGSKSGAEYSGTGIGLAVCKGLVEMMGGVISVESNPAKGTVFRFTLPALPSE
jgi:signal transduction histidine kinase